MHRLTECHNDRARFGISRHIAAVYALIPPYYNTCADLKGGGGIWGGGGSLPSPSPLYKSLHHIASASAAEWCRYCKCRINWLTARAVFSDSFGNCCQHLFPKVGFYCIDLKICKSGMLLRSASELGDQSWRTEHLITCQPTCKSFSVISLAFSIWDYYILTQNQAI